MSDRRDRPCAVCGDDKRGAPGDQCYLARDNEGEHCADFLHRECVAMWVDGMFIRLDFGITTEDR